MQSAYSTVTADWASLEECYPSAEVQSVYSIAPSDWASFGESYPTAEMQSVYSTALVDWASFGKSYPSVEVKTVYSTARYPCRQGNVCLYDLNFNKMHWEKQRLEQHEIVPSVLNKSSKRHSSITQTKWNNRLETIGEVKINSFIHQRLADTGYRLDDIPKAMSEI